MEDLDRGLVVVRALEGNYVGWRMLGYEYDAEEPERIAYNLYRDTQLVASVTDSTNFLDENAASDAQYQVAVVIDGSECTPSAAVSAWRDVYLGIPLEPPPAGTTPAGESYAYDIGTVQRSSGAVNDGSPGDLDGDGKYEIVVIWEPSNAKDNANAGYTGPVYVDAYGLDGSRLWRMNLGPNVRAGAHYTQFLVYDLDGDGAAEVAFRTAPGVRDGTGEFLSLGPAADDDDGEDYRNGEGYVLSGPEYLSVFEGATGRELATVNFETARGNVSDWGDDYGNRVDRFLASVAFVSDEGGSGAGSGRPALLMARGYYTRATVNAWSFRDGTLSKLWTADSDTGGSGALAGQGAHSMVVADVDGDLAQEIVYGAAMIQSDGSFGCSTGLNHGDALHASDFIPSRPGLEVFMPHEDESEPWWDLRDAADCAVLQQAPNTGEDNGRGVAADIVADNPGAEFWSASDDEVRAAGSGSGVGIAKPPVNFLLWWDADELRELEDGTSISKGNGMNLFTCDQCMSNNYTKATPTLTADLFGDWREEIVWRTPNSSELRIFTTTAVTQRRLYTLMHDPQYRMQVSSEQTAYNQPPHTGFFLGAEMEPAPKPDIHVR
jgi:rhamnogalacturonan endolyase